MFFRKIFFWIFSCICIALPQPVPKLVIGIVIDQMRFDYLYRFRNNYSESGFKRIMNEGSNFTYAHLNYVPTNTAPGHATIYTGTTPFFHGMIGNDWYDRDSAKHIYCTDDIRFNGLGGTDRMSPLNLMCTTITDQLKLSNNGMSKVIAISIKDRGAILPGGKLANAAYWYNSQNGNFMSSSYYMHDLPEWVKEFNSKKLPEKYSGMEWSLSKPLESYRSSFPDESRLEPDLFEEGRTSFPHSLKNIKEADKLEFLKSTPYGNQLLKDFALAVLDNEKLGQNTVTDFLTISFSSTDYIGHRYGPNSVEIQDTYIKLDEQIGDLLKILDDKIGKGNYLLFLTADHGVSEIPDLVNSKVNKTTSSRSITKFAKDFLLTNYGTDKIFSDFSNKQIFLNNNLISEMKLNSADIRSKLAQQIRKNFNSVLLIFTKDDFVGRIPDRNENNFLLNGFNPIRSGDILIELNPESYFNLGGMDRTTHGTGYSYDTHVPLLFYGWNIPANEINDPVFTTDIAPTISNLLKITEPSGCIGKPIIKLNSNFDNMIADFSISLYY
ncbi:MAG: alkaline phosphatase family protein [Ignavibacteriaceae bacterium]|nr:alkaline phosphatase family protein [Ignavibacteriaceae bacterium]